MSAVGTSIRATSSPKFCDFHVTVQRPNNRFATKLIGLLLRFPSGWTELDAGG
jgi:hypothetical protein